MEHMNRLFYGDNLEVLRSALGTETVDLVYLDPPFNSNRGYNVIFARHDTKTNAQIQAFDDTWYWTPVTDSQYRDAISGGLPPAAGEALRAMYTLLGENDAMAYMVNMAPRLVELHRVLKADGALVLHCDPTMSHYLKILLDTIFGASNFRNEIIWDYTFRTMHLPQRLSSKHDVLFYYAKSAAHLVRTPTLPWTREDIVATRKQKIHVDEEGREWVWMPGGRGHSKNKPKFIEDIIREGKAVSDVWHIPIISSSSKERLGYPTQKPLALLNRVVEMASDPGDIVLDPFCGCGTTVDAAEKLGRNWVGIDITYIAIDLIEKRLRHTYGGLIQGTYEVLGIPRDFGAAQALFKRDPFEFERWAVTRLDAQPHERQQRVGDKGIDGVAKFPLDVSGKTIGRVLVSVKGGKHVGPTAVRDLVGTLESQKAEMGVLITLHEPSHGVLDAVNHGGIYTHPGDGKTFPRVQVITVEELLAGKRPHMPVTINPYIQAQRQRPQTGELF